MLGNDSNLQAMQYAFKYLYNWPQDSLPSGLTYGQEPAMHTELSNSSYVTRTNRFRIS